MRREKLKIFFFLGFALLAGFFPNQPAFGESSAVLSDPKYQQYLSDPAVQKAMQDPKVMQYLASPQGQQAISDPALRNDYASPDTRESLKQRYLDSGDIPYPSGYAPSNHLETDPLAAPPPSSDSSGSEPDLDSAFRLSPD